MDREKFGQQTIPFVDICLYGLLGLAVIFLPIVLWQLDLPFISYTDNQYYQLFELFGFCASLSLIIIAYIELKKRCGESFQKLLLVILPLLVAFYFLGFISEYSIKSYDYDCYERAAKAIIQGTSVYGKDYLYPPLTAQLMVVGYRFTKLAGSVFQVNIKPIHIWYGIFYLYQCTQFLLVNLIYFLCCQFARNIGLKSLEALALVTPLFLFNNPLLRTLKYNQVNLWILSLMLLAILFVQRYPLISGFVIAFASHIKIYPLILLFLWGITKRWRAVVGGIVSLFGIVLIQTNWGQNWELWSQFLTFFGSFPKGTGFRDNGLHSIVYNFSRMTGLSEAMGRTGYWLIQGTVFVATFAVAIWFVMRFVEREKAYNEVMGTTAVSHADSHWKSTLRLYSHSMDALAFILIIAPIVWEHHYVLAMPVLIWAVAVRGRDKPWQIGIGAFLMFALPTFDVFPLSYHRVVGLLMVVYFTSPGSCVSLTQETPGTGVIADAL